MRITHVCAWKRLLRTPTPTPLQPSSAGCRRQEALANGVRSLTACADAPRPRRAPQPPPPAPRPPAPPHPAPQPPLCESAGAYPPPAARCWRAGPPLGFAKAVFFTQLCPSHTCKLDAIEAQPDVANLLTGLTWRSLLTGTGDRFQYVV
jgi:hypothetical protein